MAHKIFDDKGHICDISDLEQYLTLQLDEDIEHTYIVNKMWHMENMGLEWLVANGHGIAKGKPYPKEEFEKTLTIISEFMVENYAYTKEQFKKLDDKALDLLKQL